MDGRNVTLCLQNFSAEVMQVGTLVREEYSTQRPLDVFRHGPAESPTADHIDHLLDLCFYPFPTKDPARKSGSVDNSEGPKIVEETEKV